jgi:GNAT superfamily N-acetyltransferase
MQIEYKWYDDSHKDGVIDVLRFLWELSKEDRTKLFVWKYLQNPTIDKTIAFVAVIDGEVIGFRGYFPQYYIVDGKKELILSVSDTVVNPNYRRKGIFVGLTQFTEAEIKNNYNTACYLNLTPSWPTIPGYEKIGWKTIRKKSFFTYFSLFNILSWANVLFSNLNRYRIKTSEDPLEYKINHLYSNKLDRMNIYFDEISLQWRYQNPNRKYKFVYLLDKKDNIKGFLSFIESEGENVVIIDYYYSNINDFNCLISLFNVTIKPKKSTFWSFAIPGKEKWIILLNGYLPIVNVLNLLKPKLVLPFLVKKNVSLLDSYNHKNWYLKPVCSDGY